MTNKINKVRRLLFLAAFAFFILAAAAAGSRLQAQETAQIILTGIRPVLSSPFLDDLRNDYDSGRYQVQFIYNTQLNQPRDFRFRFQVIKNGDVLIDETSNLRRFAPGTHFLDPFFREINFGLKEDDIIGLLDPGLAGQVIQTGMLPEANYMVRIDVLPEQNQPLISTIPAIVTFSVRLPQPPTLISPPDEGIVSLQTPVFVWTPVVGFPGLSSEYEFLLVELFEGQNPADGLIENQPHHETILSQTTLVYTPDLFPLEQGRRYAWQVTARDVTGELPFVRDGRSEVYEFRFGEPQEEDEQVPAVLEKITLIAQFLEITDLSGTQSRVEGNQLVLSGPAVAEIQFAQTGLSEIPVMLDDLRLINNNLQNPMILGGRVELDEFAFSELLAAQLPDEASLTDIRWMMGTGIQASLAVDAPAAGFVIADGLLSINSAGIFGTTTVSGAPLLALEDSWLALELTQLRYEFPGVQLSGAGSVRVLGEDSGCELTNLSGSGEELQAGFMCDQAFDISLSEASELMKLSVNRISGSVQISPAAETLSYDLSLRSRLGLLTESGTYCGTGIDFGLSSAGGISILQQSPFPCPDPNPTLSLGFGQLALTATTAETVVYEPQSGLWDVALDLSGRLLVPAFSNWQSGQISNIRLTNQGILFPAVNFADMLTPLPVFNAERLQISLDEFFLDEFLFPWFEWDGQYPGPWEAGFSGNALVRSGQQMPSCLVGLQLPLSNGRIETGMQRIIGDLSTQTLSNCQVNPAAGFSMQLTEAGGSAGFFYLSSGETEAFGRLGTSGRLLLNEPFSCSGSSAEGFAFTGNDIAFSTGINGALDWQDADCRVQVGALEADVQSLQVQFDREEWSPQRASLTAQARLNLSAGMQAEGSLVYDLMDASFTQMSFDLDQPFEWQMPVSGAPQFTLLVEEAEIQEEGLRINGRHRIRVGSTEMAATFDNLIIGLETGRIRSGRLIPDGGFRMEALIPENLQQPAFSLTDRPFEADPAAGPLLWAETGEQLIIDASGIRPASGSEQPAALIFGGETFTGLQLTFSDDFALNLQNMRIRAGYAELRLPGTGIIGRIDEGGFHPDLEFLDGHLIPELLPLPHSSIAALQLREGNTYFVETELLENGSLRISAAPGVSPRLILPYFGSSGSFVFDEVVLEELIITRGQLNSAFVSGRISAEVPQGSAFADLTALGIPLFPERVVFEPNPESPSAQPELFLEGEAELLGRRLSGGEPVRFSLGQDAVLRGSFTISDQGGELPLWEERLRLAADRLTAEFSYANGIVLRRDLSIRGSLQLRTDSGYQHSGALTVNITSDNFTEIDFRPQPFSEAQQLSFGEYAFSLTGIQQVTNFSYAPESGLMMHLVPKAGLSVPLAGSTELQTPLLSLRITKNGLNMPPQQLDESTVPGLIFEPFVLNGFRLRPYYVRFTEAVAFAWEHADAPESISGLGLGLQLELPAFLQETNLNPPDGLLFNEVLYTAGILTGSLDPWQPLGGAVIPASAAHLGNTLRVSEVSGQLSGSENDNDNEAQTGGQELRISLQSRIETLTAFEITDEAACAEQPAFTLELDGQQESLSGTVADFPFCGQLPLGPLAAKPGTGTLLFGADEGGGSLMQFTAATGIFPRDENGDTSEEIGNGELQLDLYGGKITGGSVPLSGPFPLPVRWDREQAFFTLNVQTASLSSAGLTLTDEGQLQAGDAAFNISFEALQFSLPDFEVTGGQAVAGAEVLLEASLNPIRFRLVSEETPQPEGAFLRFTSSEGLILDAAGMRPQSGSEGFIRFQGTSYSGLVVAFSEDFALRYGGTGVSSGRVSFFRNAADEEPLAYLSPNGFVLPDAPIAELPERLFLPDEETGWVMLRDEQGQLLVNMSTQQDGNLLISSDGNPLTVTLPGLDYLEIQASAALTVDALFNVTGGDLILTESVSVSALYGDLPLRISSLRPETGEEFRLMAGLAVTLPLFLTGDADMAETLLQVQVLPQGLRSGYVATGYNSNTYEPDVSPLMQRSVAGTVNGSEDEAVFIAQLLGIEAALGTETALMLTGTIESSLLQRPGTNGGTRPMLLRAAWLESNWVYELEPEGTAAQLRLGEAHFIPQNHQPFSVTGTADSFVVSLNGQVSFDSIFNEEIRVQLSGLGFGLTGLADGNPELYFGLADEAFVPEFQQLQLFNGALTADLESPELFLSGQALGVVSAGTFTYFDHAIPFEELVFNTSGEISVPEIDLGEDPLEILGEYITLIGLELTYEEDAILRLGSTFDFMLPDPFADRVAESSLSIRIQRNANGTVVVDEGGLLVLFEEEAMQVTLGQFGQVDLQRVRAVIDPINPQNRALYASAFVSVLDRETNAMKPVIFFGNEDEDGIGVSRINNEIDISYNVTGNVGFSFDMSFFRLDIEAGITTTSENPGEFSIALGGRAGLVLSGVEGDIGLEDIKIGRPGVRDFGRISGPASISVINALELEIGSFFRHADAGGFTLEITETAERDPEELRSMAGQMAEPTVETRLVTGVTEVVCFGPCPFTVEGMDPINEDGDTAINVSVGGNQSDFTGTAQAFYFYRAGSDISLSVEGVEIALSEIFTMTADFQYAQEGGGVLIRAAGTGQFKIGNNQVSTIVAGKFSNINNQLSFGFFVAAGGNTGVPI
ncbi:MAG: hypothetical protein LAT75_10695, partial [Candidatus Cyclonatronum sp.]